MDLSRRHLLGSAAVAGFAGTVTSCEPDQPRRAQLPATFDPTSWASVRAQFALDESVAHLAAFVFATHPQAVRAAIDTHRDGFDRDPIGYVHGQEAARERAVADAAASYLDTKAGAIAFTDSTTMGLGLLYSGLRLRAGDEILTTEHDFYSTHESLRLRTARDGATVRRVRLYDTAPDTGDIVTRLLAAVTPRTRIVAVTWVHSSTGVRLPIAEIAAALRQKHPEALLCVDGVHGFGAVDATPAQLGCDFLVSGCHKWLHGPRGTGLIWGSARGWSAYQPLIPPFGPTDLGPGAAATPGGYHSFEHRWALNEAFALHTAIGRARVSARITELASALKEGLSQIRGLTLITPKDPALSAGIVCCDIPGLSVNAAVSRLRQAGVVASATPYDPSYLRFGTTILNSERDVEAALTAVRRLI